MIFCDDGTKCFVEYSLKFDCNVYYQCSFPCNKMNIKECKVDVLEGLNSCPSFQCTNTKPIIPGEESKTNFGTFAQIGLTVLIILGLVLFLIKLRSCK